MVSPNNPPCPFEFTGGGQLSGQTGLRLFSDASYRLCDVAARPVKLLYWGFTNPSDKHIGQ